MMHRDSCECSTEELALDQVPQTVSVLDKAKWEEIYPVSAIDNRNPTAPIEFDIKGHGDRYMDLSQTYVFMTFKVKKADRSDLANDTQTTPVNNFLHSMFSDVDLTLGDKLLTSGTDTYPYRAYLEKLLSYSPSTLKNQIRSSSIWIKDQAGRLDAVNPYEDTATDPGYNEGLIERGKLVKESKEVSALDRLHLDMFQQKKYLINGVGFRLKFHRARTPFCLMGDADGAVDITSMIMYVRKVKPMPGVLNRINQMLNTTTAKYPIRRVEVKSFTILTGTRSKITDNVFAGQLPKRVFVGLVENAAYNGALDKNPFHFRHFDVSKVDVTLNGESQASRAFEPKFGAEKLYLRSYMSLYQTLGRIDDDWSPSISYEEYGDGFTLWGYDFTTDQNAHKDQFHLLKTGNMCIELQFNTALTQTINCIVYAEFDNVVEINKQREVNHDY